MGHTASPPGWLKEISESPVRWLVRVGFQVAMADAQAMSLGGASKRICLAGCLRQPLVRMPAASPLMVNRLR